MKLEEVRDGLLGKAGINVRVNLRDAPRWVHGDERRLMIFQFGKGRHCSKVYTNGRFCFLLFMLEASRWLNMRFDSVHLKGNVSLLILEEGS
jgi:hypothetical protein